MRSINKGASKENGMKEIFYQILNIGISNKKEAKKGKDIWYLLVGRAWETRRG